MDRCHRERNKEHHRMSLEDRLYPLLSIYESLPPFVRQIIGLGFRSLPRRLRLGAAYGDFRKLIEKSYEWDEDEIREYQLLNLRKSLIHAGNYCPYYQRAFAKAKFQPETLHDFSDLSKCPMLTKEDLLSSRDQMISTQIPKNQRLYITTGGSTGVPVGFYLQKGISRPKEQAFLEAMWRRAGYSDNAKVAVIRGHVTDSKSGGKIAKHDYTRNWLLLSSYHLTEERLPDYLLELERFQPEFLHAYPSAALLLAEYLEKTQQKLRINLRALLCGSERLTFPQKRLLERVFRCRVYRWYGHAERVVLAGEGEQSELFYFFPHYGHVEFGPPDEDGLCEVIGTSFHNMAMPLVRYRTGDYIKLPDPFAERELAWTAVGDIVGREQEFLVSASGRRISLTAINMHDSVFDGLYAVQFYQDQPGVAELRYVAGPDFHTSRIDGIREGICRKLGDDFEIILSQVDETEKTARGKHKWLVSHLK